MTGITAIFSHNWGGVIWISTNEAGGVMTGSALGVRVMGIVAVVRTHGDCAVVTTGALPDDSCMVEAAVRVQVQEMISVMAVATFCVGLDMEFRFSDRRNIVMAITAGPENLIMIDYADQVKPVRSMTGLTQVAGTRMCNRFTSGSTAVMAGMTGLASHFGSAMIDDCVLEALSIMATATVLCSNDVVTRFSQADHTIMTGRTGVLIKIQLSMVEYTRGKAARGMTNHTIFSGSQMSLRRGWLTGGIVTIMTGSTAHAGYSRIRMIYKSSAE